jgi:hypothetical protein
MTDRAVRPGPDQFRKARYRDEAREIVAKDRHDRKYGQVVDTAGAIARALERAYKQGFADAQGGELGGASPKAEPGDAVEWELIPPRPRNAFWSCCLFMLGHPGEKSRRGHLVPCITARGTPGWRLVIPDFNHDEVIGGKTIAPLVRLRLLEPDREDAHRLVISSRGAATWRRFIDRGGRYPEDVLRQ